MDVVVCVADDRSPVELMSVKSYLRDPNWRIVTDQVLSMWLELNVIGG